MKNAEILVIEDKNNANISIKSKLEYLGYTVLAIEFYGIKTIKDSGKLKPDLILMDVSQSTCGITSRIREYFDGPIIYVTDHLNNSILEKVQLTPPVYILRKQFNDIELKNTIETALYNNFKLKDSTKNLNAFLNAVNEPAFLIDLKGNILFTNEYTEKTLVKAVDSNIYELLPPHIATYRKKYVEMAIKTKKVTHFEDERYNKKYEYRIYPILDEKDEVSKLSIIGLDVTERKLAENALKESEEKYRSIFDNSTNAIFLTRPDGSILDANPAAEEMYGYSKHEMCKLGRSGILDTDDPQLNSSLNERAITGKFKGEFTSIKKDGTKFLTDVTGKLFKDNKGNDKGIIIANDITKRKEIENELKENQRTFKTLISNLPGVVYKCRNDPNWTMEFVSEGCLELTGYQPEDIFMNKNISYEDLIHHDDRQIVRDTIYEALKENEPFKITYRIITADLKEKYVWEQGRGIFSPEGELIALEGFITDITKRREAEKALKKSELYYRTIFENTGTATLIAGEDTIISLANTECEKLSGYLKEELEGKKSWLDFAVEEDIEMLLNYHHLRENNQITPKNYEIMLKNKHGDIRDVYVTIELIPYTQNRVISLLDITDKKKSRQALRENEKKYRQLVENAHEGIWSVDTYGNTLFVNPKMAYMLGYTVDEMMEMHLLSFMDEKDAKIVENSVKNYMDIDEDLYEFEFIKKNGKKIYVSIDITHIHDDYGNYIETLALISDITERKKAEEKLRLASAYNRSLIEASLDPLVTIGSDGKITDVNKSTENITGYSRKRLIGTDFSDYFTKPEKARKGYQEVFKEGLVRDYPLEIKNKNGNITPVLYNASVYKDESGKVIGVFAAARDITEHKRAEKELKESEHKYRTLFNSSPDYTIFIGTDGRLIDVNEAAQKVTGLSQEELIGKNFTELDFLLDNEMPSHLEYASQALKGNTIKPHESKFIDGNGEIRYVETHLTPLEKDNKICGFNVISHDISERKMAEEQIRSSLNEKELLLREIHHRVKNNLQIISSLLSLQKRYITDNETRNVFEESQNRVKSIAMVHEKLYNSESLVKIDFKDYIKDLTDSLFLTYRVSPAKIKLNKKIDNTFFNINTAIPCGLIINELVTNSLKHAFPQIAGKKCENNEIQISLQEIQSNFVLIVSDNGIGLPEDVDFKNTESLGLQLVNSLVKQIDGTIELDKSKGTEFKIIFKELKYKERI